MNAHAKKEYDKYLSNLPIQLNDVLFFELEPLELTKSIKNIRRQITNYVFIFGMQFEDIIYCIFHITTVNLTTEFSYGVYVKYEPYETFRYGRDFPNENECLEYAMQSFFDKIKKNPHILIYWKKK